MSTDPISDMLARIRNASMARHELMRLPASSLKKNVAEILKAEGYVADVRQEE
jgi:small subunit ribosomal protein S8